MTGTAIQVVMNADDFGMNESANEAIAVCFSRSLITSATLMANGDAFDDACQRAADPDLHGRLGVHLNLTDGHALTDDVQGSRLANADGRLRLEGDRPGFLSSADRDAARAEVVAQIQRCRDHGVQPTHADSHRHIHTHPRLIGPVTTGVRAAGIGALRLARNVSPGSWLRSMYKSRLNRRLTRQGMAHTTYFCDLTEFLQAVDSTTLRPGIYEVMVHPVCDAEQEIADSVDGAPLLERLGRVAAAFELVPSPKANR